MNEQFINRFHAEITIRCGVSDGTPLLAGLSGGPDSVALVSALTATGFPVTALHMNFHMRGEESDRDARCAASVAEALGIRFVARDVDVDSYRRLHRGLSVEMACRRLRYDWFADVQRLEGGMPIAVAHHRDDNAETMMLNLMRGGGLSGLRGMLPRSGAVVRPLLQFSREEIMRYVESEGLPFVIDSSNLNNDYRRNRLRNDVIPRLRQCFPDADGAIARSMANLASTESLLDELAEDARQNYSAEDGSIDLQRLVSERYNSATLLYWWLRQQGFNYTQCSDMIASVGRETMSGQRFVSAEHVALIDRGRLYLSLIEDSDDVPVAFCPSDFDGYPSGLKASVVEAGDVTFSRDVGVIYLDYEQVVATGRDFMLRRPQTGDRLQPFGMKGSRLVSDVLAEARLSPLQRCNVRVLTLDDKILWVTGVRASCHFSVTRMTQRVLRLCWSAIE